jgi:AAA+ superfamily predicted ATPase
MSLLFEIGKIIAESEKDDTKEKYNIECFATTDGKSYMAREATNTVKALPPGVYQYQMNHGTMYFVKQDIPTCKIVGDKTQQGVLAELDKFWNGSELYQQLGFPHKRGVLLYGLPGMGKTTLIRLIIQDVMSRGGICLELGHFGTFPAAMDVFRAACPTTPVVVMVEDLDRYMDGGYEEAILNVLDGSFAIEHVLFVASTNKKEDLSERLIRPSRFDCPVEIKPPDAEARRNYIKGLIPNAPDAAVEDLVAKSNNKSIADLKELVLQRTLYKRPT